MQHTFTHITNIYTYLYKLSQLLFHKLIITILHDITIHLVINGKFCHSDNDSWGCAAI